MSSRKWEEYGIVPNAICSTKNTIMKYLKNPYIVSAICMVLFVLMYNNATNSFMRTLSYIPLLVVVGILLRGLYFAFKK